MLDARENNRLTREAAREPVCSIEDHRARVSPVLARHGIRRAALFGSLVRGEAGPDSDVDLLVEYPSDIGYSRLCDLYDDLELVLGRRVEIAHPRLLKERLRDEVLAERVELL